MRRVRRSAIVSHPAGAMFDLVADVERYPAFLPGCTGAVIRERRDDEVVATLTLAQGMLKTGFTTRNRMTRPQRIAMELLEGPFRDLHGVWEFAHLGEAGCRVSLDLSFEFDSRLKDLLLGPPFEALCNHLVDAFVRRANADGGKRRQHRD
jgi:ribosome-associated toxin RatA of RatAB toxin-antitoxin module